MPRFDKDEVKQAAAGRWPEVFASLANQSATIFDGKHHACPKCGGADRFRFIDRAEGACLCNQCFTTKNGDGISVVQWLTGWSFGESLSAIAKYCNVKPLKSKGTDPASLLEWLPWNETLAGLWCLQKKPIKTDAIKRIGGRFARYRNQYTVVAIPVWGPSLDEQPAVGWIIYRPDGRELPKGPKDSTEWVKVKLVEGSGQGVVCNPRTFDCEGEIWKTEGSTDLLTLLSVDPEASAFTTANGTTEKPLDWIVKLCEGRDVIVIHDADKPGQDGATWVSGRDGSRRPGWCPRLAEQAKTVRNLTLPFPIEATKGPDLRDFFAGGGSMESLRERLATAEPFGVDQPSESPIEEDEDDPQRLARINLERYRSEHDGRLIFWCDEWWKWKDGRYRRIANNELRCKVWAAIRKEFEHCWRERRAKGDDKPIKKVSKALVINVIGAMESMCSIPFSVPMPCWLPDRSQPHYVATTNGILNLDAVFAERPESEFLLTHSPDWFSTFRLNYPFDINAECPKWLRFIASSMENDAERISILQEWAGYLLTTSNYMQKFVAFEGDGGNGKTVFFAGMEAMLGKDNVGHVALERFGGQFDLATTLGKSLNICNDVGEVDRVAEAELKQFTGGDAMQFDRKNRDPLTAVPSAKLMLSWNRRPNFRDRSNGLWRRMILVPFNYTPDAEHIVRGMDQSDWWIDQGEASGILLWAIAGLARLKEQGRFTRSSVCENALDEIRKHANPALEFLSEYVVSQPGSKIPKSHLYELYQHFCMKTGNKHPLTQQKFGKEVFKVFPGCNVGKATVGHQRKDAYTEIAFSVDEIFSKSVEQEKLF